MNNEYINLFKEFLPFFTAKLIQGTPLLKELCKGCLFPFVNITITSPYLQRNLSLTKNYWQMTKKDNFISNKYFSQAFIFSNNKNEI